MKLRTFFERAHIDLDACDFGEDFVDHEPCTPLAHAAVKQGYSFHIRMLTGMSVGDFFGIPRYVTSVFRRSWNTSGYQTKRSLFEYALRQAEVFETKGPCNCTGLSHSFACPHWVMPL